MREGVDKDGGIAQLIIDPEAIARNWRAIDAMSPAETGAVVKADAYGLGVDRAAPALWRAGARRFFVAESAEITPLKIALTSHATSDLRIYVFNGSPAHMADIVALDARPVLNTMADIRAARALAERRGRTLACAIRIETGMNRFGLTEDEVGELTEASGGRELSVEILMSHLACADVPGHALNQAQRERFCGSCDRLRAIFPDALASLGATGGALLGPPFAFDLLRPGVGLYGGAPFREAEQTFELRAPIVRIWDIGAGESSGYGGVWIAEKPSRLATLPIGYADGFPRALSGRGEVLIAGARAPIAGRVSMDSLVIDISDLTPAPVLGDMAVLIGRDLRLDKVAARADTVGYELLTRLDAAKRLERRSGVIS